MIRSEYLLLYPDTIKVCLDEAYLMSARGVNHSKNGAYLGKGYASGR